MSLDEDERDLDVADDAIEEAPGAMNEGVLREHATRLHVAIAARHARDSVTARDILARAAAGKLTPEDRVKIATGARATLARRHLFHFFKQAWGVLEPDTPLEVNWHHRLLCDHVQGMLDDWLAKQKDPSHQLRAQNAVFNFPPGTTKSRILSVMVMAWMWIHRPSWSVLCLSANPDVATRDASFARDIVTSDWYRSMFGITWTIREDIDAKGNYRNTAGGSRVSRGITSRIVGSRAACLLIDDPNDMHDVFSEASRREVNGKIDNSIWNRVNDMRSSLRIVLQQRGHLEDASGHLMRKLGTDPRTGGVMFVPVPMDFDPNLRIRTPFGYHDPRTVPGESMHPARFTSELLANERARLGTFGYETQYNQRARLLEGHMFKRAWFRFFKVTCGPHAINGHQPMRPDGCVKHETHPAMLLKERALTREEHWTKRLDLDWCCITVDASFGSTSDSASQVGLIVVGGKGALRYVLDDRTDVMDFEDTCKNIVQLKTDYPIATRVLVENKANGAAVINVMKKRFTGFIALEPEGGKVARANAMSPAYESGNVLLLDGAKWVGAHIEELALFNRGPYDDRVDAMSQLMHYAETKMMITAAWDAMSS